MEIQKFKIARYYVANYGGSDQGQFLWVEEMLPDLYYLGSVNEFSSASI